MKTFRILFFGVVALAAQTRAERLPVLIIDGQNNHDWKQTTPVLRSTLEATGRFSTEVFTATNGDAWKTGAPDFTRYRAIVLNYNGAPWPATAWSGFEKYMKDGGGLVVIHAALATFPENEAYNRMIGLGWRKAGQGTRLGFDQQGSPISEAKGGDSGHGALGPFSIDIRVTKNPITAGFPARWIHAPDELYHTLRGPARDLEILATALSPVTNINEPVLWTVPFGKGRVFCSTLGHDARSLAGRGFQSSFTRGTEWAATGVVTLPVTVEMPASQGAGSAGQAPSRAVIERNIDKNITVTGKYAAVKLPLKNGPALRNPTRIVTTPQGMIFVANYTGEILRLKDTDGDGLEDTTELFTNIAQIGLPAGQALPPPGIAPPGPGLRYPTAMTFKDGWLYVGTTQEIQRFEVKADGTCGRAERFASGWPYTMHYFDWTFGMKFGKDGWLYAILCTDYLNPKPAPDPDGLRGSMIRISPDGKKFERFACGLRFAYGLAINDAGDIFFTDNQGGENNKVEELNHAVKDGNYGHHPKNPSTPAREPILAVRTDASPDGCAFNPTANRNFGDTAGDLFIACWGNDGRWDKGGIARVRLTKRADGEYDAVEETFSKGPAKVSDLAFAPTGDMYVARFGHEGPLHTPYATPEGGVYRYISALWLKQEAAPFINPLLTLEGDPNKGREIFTQRACVTCHTIDGSSTLLGPDLGRIGLTMDRAGLRESIENPSANIKTDYDTAKLTRKDGKELIGRIASSDEVQVAIMQPGNVTETIPRAEIRSIEMLPTSLMPPGLSSGLGEAGLNDLLAYIESLGRETTVRIHAGGEAIRLGEATYGADLAYRPKGLGYRGGKTIVARESDTAGIGSCRYGDFSYRFDASEGEYDVTLTFGEWWKMQTGGRVFSVLANENPVITDLDVFKEAGAGKPLTKTFRVKAKAGAIILDFKAKADNPMVSLIEVKPIKPAP